MLDQLLIQQQSGAAGGNNITERFYTDKSSGTGAGFVVTKGTTKSEESLSE